MEVYYYNFLSMSRYKIHIKGFGEKIQVIITLVLWLNFSMTLMVFANYILILRSWGRMKCWELFLCVSYEGFIDSQVLLGGGRCILCLLNF